MALPDMPLARNYCPRCRKRWQIFFSHNASRLCPKCHESLVTGQVQAKSEAPDAVSPSGPVAQEDRAPDS